MATSDDLPSVLASANKASDLFMRAPEIATDPADLQHISARQNELEDTVNVTTAALTVLAYADDALRPSPPLPGLAPAPGGGPAHIQGGALGDDLRRVTGGAEDIQAEVRHLLSLLWLPSLARGTGSTKRFV